jgi:chromosome segregation ATPase
LEGHELSDEPLTAILAAVERLERGQERLERGYGGLETRYEGLERGFGGLNAGYQRLERGFERLHESYERLHEGYERLHDGHERLHHGHERLLEGHERLSESHERLARGQERLRVDLMARMERLENTVSGIRDDITVNMARADRAHAVADNTRDEVRLLGEQVNAMGRQIQRLQTDMRQIKGEP